MAKVLQALRTYRQVVRSHKNQLWRQLLNEPLNRGRKSALLRDYLDWHLRYKYRGKRWVISFENGLHSYVYPYPDHDAGEVNIWTSNVDYYDIRLTLAILEPGDFAVDAGCNVGNRTLAIAHRLSGALLIDAGANAVARCRENLALNGLSPEQFSVVHAAVGENEGEVFFTDLGGANTCNKVVDPSDVGSRLIRTRLTTIDAEVSRMGRLPVFIKVDVEGQDFKALLGARKTLESGAVRLVKFERNQTEPLEPFLKLFGELGWKVFALDRRGRVTQDDSLVRKHMNLFAAPPHIYARLAGLERN